MGIGRSKVKIYIVNAGVAPSAVTSTDIIDGEIKSYSKSGGAKDVESDPLFGGFADKEKPQEQVELSFEIVPTLGTNASRWDSFAYAADTQVTSGATVYTMADVSLQDKAVYIGQSDGTNGKAFAFNNCNVTLLDMEHNADDNESMNMTLKFSPTDDSGVSNFMTRSTTNLATPILAVNYLPAWTALDNN